MSRFSENLKNIIKNSPLLLRKVLSRESVHLKDVKKNSKPTKWRSLAAQTIHHWVMEICETQDTGWFEYYTKMLKKSIEENVSGLGEASIHNYTHLHDAVRIPFLKPPIELAKKKSALLLKILLDEMSARMKEEDFKTLLLLKNERGLMALHEAVISNHVDAVEILASKLEELGLLSENLQNDNKDSYSLFQHALITQNEELIKKMIELYEKTLLPFTWQGYLKKQTSNGYTPFHSVINSGKISIIKIYLDAMQKAFGNDTFTVLQDLMQNNRNLFFKGKDWRNSSHQQEIRKLVTPYFDRTKKNNTSTLMNKPTELFLSFSVNGATSTPTQDNSSTAVLEITQKFGKIKLNS